MDAEPESAAGSLKYGPKILSRKASNTALIPPVSIAISGISLAIAAIYLNATPSLFGQLRPASIVAGLALGAAEIAVILNLYLWAGRSLSKVARAAFLPMPQKTSGWIWLIYRGTLFPLVDIQRRYRRFETGTVFVLVLIMGDELLLRTTQLLLARCCPLVGIIVSLTIGVALKCTVARPWYRSLFGVLLGLFSGLNHALVLYETGDIVTVLVAQVTAYLLLMRF